jgi:chromosome partitioning protein
MTLRIACTNQKGGTGKTTTTINLAGALARRGHEVLVVDLDPQGHSTEALGFSELYVAETASLYHALAEVDRTALVNDLVVEAAEFDLVPSHEHMGTVESTLTTERRREERLGMVLDDLEADYDVLLIDCPPNLGLLTDNALLATRHVVVPSQTRRSAKRAVEILVEQIEEVETTFGVEIELLGVVANEYRRDGESEAMVEWYRERFGADAVYVVPTRVALQRAWNANVSIFEHEESAEAAEAAFDGLAARVESRLAAGG